MSTKLRIRAAALVLALAAVPACKGESGDTCLAPVRDDGPEGIEVKHHESQEPYELEWWCAAPPPAALLDGRYRTEKIWVEGPCDPCDRERIAAVAARQPCSQFEVIPARLLCGPIPHEARPWDQEGCVYLIASDIDCIVD